MMIMPTSLSLKLLIVVSAVIVVSLAGTGAYLEATLGASATVAFVVRLLLLFVAVVGAFLLGLALRLPPTPGGLSPPPR